MEKDKKSNKVIQRDNFVMYNDIIIPSSPEQQFMNDDLQAMENVEQSKEDVKLNNLQDSYYDGFDEWFLMLKAGFKDWKTLKLALFLKK